MFRSFTANGNRRWVDNLQSLVDGYNDSKHSSTEFKPNEVNKRNEHLVRRILYPKIDKKKIYTNQFLKSAIQFELRERNQLFKKDMNKLLAMKFFKSQRLKIPIL